MAAKMIAKVEKASASEHKWKLQVVYEPLDKLTLWKDNPRKNDDAAGKLCTLLSTHGFVNPVIATPDGIIRAGNTRFKAAQKLGLKTVPVIYVPFGSEEEAEMYSVSDNKASEWAEWDQSLLNSLFAHQKKVSVNALSVRSGFTPMEIEGIRAQKTSFASQTFAEAVEEFEKKTVATGADSGFDKDLWAWIALPDKKALTALLEKFGVRKSKELSTGKLLKALGISTGGQCPECKGTGGENHRKRCKACKGTGLRCRDEKAETITTPKKVRKVGC